MYIMKSAPGAKTVIDKKEVDYFGGSGYYGLQGHPELIDAACEAVKKYGISSATSTSVYGNNPPHLEVEAKAAEFFGTDGALYYVSGYFGSALLLEGLKDEYDIIFYDSESHYSIVNACLAVGKPVFRFKYRSPDDLARNIKRSLGPQERPMLITDGVFPISGEIAPLPQYIEIMSKIKGSVICVDDAHAAGVIGEKGLGTFEYFGIEGERFYSCATMSKAFGGHGGVIAGSDRLIKKIKENAKILYAVTPPTSPAAAATAKAIDILQRNPGLRRKLWDNTAYARNLFRALGFDLEDTPIPIICLHGDRGIDYKALQQELLRKDIAVLYLPQGAYTSVPPGGALRISIFSSHTREQIDRLVNEIKCKI